LLEKEFTQRRRGAEDAEGERGGVVSIFHYTKTIFRLINYRKLRTTCDNIAGYSNQYLIKFCLLYKNKIIRRI
jgi:hypothetical protein